MCHFPNSIRWKLLFTFMRWRRYCFFFSVEGNTCVWRNWEVCIKKKKQMDVDTSKAYALSTDDMITFVFKKKKEEIWCFFPPDELLFDKLASRHLLQIVTLHQQHHSTTKLCNAMSAEFHVRDLVFWCVVDT